MKSVSVDAFDRAVFAWAKCGFVRTKRRRGVWEAGGRKMSLMISIEDAVKVLREDCVINGKEDEEWIREELEQKSYIFMKRKSASWVDLLIGEIDEVMNIHSIAKHIEDGTLRRWLEDHKNVAMAKLEMIAKHSQEEEEGRAGRQD